MEALFLVIVIAVGWFWYDSARIREQAVRAAKRACERHSVLLLDETVMLERLRLRRDRSGRARWRREYGFEFSGDEGCRHKGRLVLFAGRIVELELMMPDGTLYDTH